MGLLYFSRLITDNYTHYAILWLKKVIWQNQAQVLTFLWTSVCKTRVNVFCCCFLPLSSLAGKGERNGDFAGRLVFGTLFWLSMAWNSFVNEGEVFVSLWCDFCQGGSCLIGSPGRGFEINADDERPIFLGGSLGGCTNDAVAGSLMGGKCRGAARKGDCKVDFDEWPSGDGNCLGGSLKGDFNGVRNERPRLDIVFLDWLNCGAFCLGGSDFNGDDLGRGNFGFVM